MLELLVFRGCFLSVLSIIVIIVCWNAGGLGRPAKRAAVRRLVRSNKVDLLLF